MASGVGNPADAGVESSLKQCCDCEDGPDCPWTPAELVQPERRQDAEDTQQERRQRDQPRCDVDDSIAHECAQRRRGEALGTRRPWDRSRDGGDEYGERRNDREDECQPGPGGDCPEERSDELSREGGGERNADQLAAPGGWGDGGQPRQGAGVGERATSSLADSGCEHQPRRLGNREGRAGDREQDQPGDERWP